MHQDRRSYFLFLVGYTAILVIGCVIALAMNNLLGACLLGAVALLLASGTYSFYRQHKMRGARVWRRPEPLSSECLDDLNAARQWSGAITHENTRLMPAETFAWNSFIVATNHDIANL